jgi:hypothetical protein
MVSFRGNRTDDWEPELLYTGSRIGEDAIVVAPNAVELQNPADTSKTI